MPEYFFFDIDANLLDKYYEILGDLPHVDVAENSVDAYDVEDMYEIDMLVSPANSYGHMNGGIDGIYSHMYPGIEKDVKAKIRSNGIQLHGRPFLPVGEAIMVDIVDKDIKMICAPTMENPGTNLRATPENIYKAIMAILKLCKDLPEDTLVAIPGLGTGVGGLTPEQSARQIRRAFDDYNALSCL